METEISADDLLAPRRSGENKICVSIIVPLHKQLPQRNQNKLIVKNAVNEAKATLKADFQDKDINTLIKKLDEMQTLETFTGAADGVGLFVGENISKIIHFPFEVKRKVVVDFSFEVRDVIFANNWLPQYFVLALSNNKTRLFKARGLGVEEVINESFPLSYEEQFQYPDRQKPKVSGSYGSEESTIREERQKNFYRHLDKLLQPYFKNNTWPIILLGVADQQALFKSITHYKNNIAINLNGNFDHFSSSEIARKIWPEVIRLRQQKDNEAINKLEKLAATGKVISGIKQVWEEINDGGKTLVVEKDYNQPGYLNQKSGALSLNVQNNDNNDSWYKIKDLVDDVIETILNGQGKVIFVENGKLAKFQKIALMDQ